MNATSLMTSGVTRPPTLRTTIASPRPRPRKWAGSTRGSMQVTTNRRSSGKTTAPSWPPPAANARLRSTAESIPMVEMAGGLVMVFLSPGDRLWAAVTEPEAGVQASQRFRRPPVPVAEQLHQRRHQQGANQAGVDQHRQGRADAVLLDEADLRGR